MKVIPNVKVGDILLGTKNLRRWIRAASLERTLRNLVEKIKTPPGVPAVQRPSKEDRFVVIANREPFFIVWDRQNHIILPFVNPTDPEFTHEFRMNRAIFAHWFIKTNETMPKVSDWDYRAQIAWLNFHLNFRLDGPGALSLGQLGGSALGWNVKQIFMNSETRARPRVQARLREAVEEAAIKRTTQKPCFLNLEALGRTQSGLGPLRTDLGLLETYAKVHTEIINTKRDVAKSGNPLIF